MIYPAEELLSYIDHFQHCVIQDALVEATNTYWLRRADQLEAARPRRGEFHGNATREELDARDTLLAEHARSCRNRAAIALITNQSNSAELVAMVVADVAGENGYAA